MELEVERRRDIGIRILLEGQVDIEADALAASFVRAEIGGFHNAGTAVAGCSHSLPL
jgi:hypothetical protein